MVLTLMYEGAVISGLLCPGDRQLGDVSRSAGVRRCCPPVRAVHAAAVSIYQRGGVAMECGRLQTVMAIFPWARPLSRWRMASGTSGS
jgi:hypothetical protein